MNSIRFFLRIVLLSMASVAQANDNPTAIEVLVNSHPAEAAARSDFTEIEGVQLRAWVTQVEPIIVTQQLDLNIEVAVPSWFTGGTKIKHFEIDNLIVLRREKFAVNSTRVIDDSTWTIQVWTINLYPQTAGRYEIPRIELELDIANETGSAIKGKVYTKSFVVNVELPSDDGDLLGIRANEWVATTDLELSETFDKSVSELKVGDAFKRTIEVKADNLAAMMLPELVVAPQEGLAVYKEPTTLVDRANRGRYQASRREVFSFLVEKPGSYTLPAIEVVWWDLGQEMMRLERLPEQMISTVGYELENSAASNDDETTTLGFEFKRVRILIGTLLLVALIAIVLMRGYGDKRPRTKNSQPNRVGQTGSLRNLKRQFHAYCAAQDYRQAESSFKQWIDLKQFELGRDTNNPTPFLCVRDFLGKYHLDDSLRCYDALTTLAYADSASCQDVDPTLQRDIETSIPRLEKGLKHYADVQKAKSESSKILLN